MQKVRFPALVLSVSVAVSACGNDGNTKSDTTQAAAPGGANQARTIKDVGFSSPETALWDSVADVYLLSNINGNPASEDNNGFIARIRPDGNIDSLKWIEGGRNGVTLHGPKGMVIKGDTLFAADVGGVRMFDRKTGQPLGTLRAATRGLNDLAIGPDGSIYATDLEPPPNGGAPSPPPASIYRMTADGAVPVVRGNLLMQPDGLVADDSGFVVAPFGENQLYRVDSTGTKKSIAVLPGSRLDGLLKMASGDWLVTSWDAKAVFVVDRGGTAVPIARDIESPAQLGFDSRRNVLLIPSFNANALEIRPAIRPK